jgi:phospholipid/cholesterol/gamma-HCH transport system permease protein
MRCSDPDRHLLKEIDAAVTLKDFSRGSSSFVFAVLVAGVGCLRGLQTWAGVGRRDAATRAVVTGIILLVVVDGLFAVAYYLLNV